ncbi:prepilin-type N-terminal cleavage/methylation domain-containing protein [Rubripirellula amarantea]|uniref:Type II secretion system protein G n=1 Tax=Rubripirellula amarantea TaxID=2527999 RepID=A0A5C5WTK9_9BACT|nr:prepilin-type N-terminal cleavage/methylation domain-containing protein [Rubripirellula amarantea]MDA8744062.1 prepilin-type N-terminal cleavage/methylation domain-containing protein [Rubripirellula amarantea]TWT54264.1 hypothetical protein Pla22_19060 [Rubripirellula amarantea]
MIKSNRSAKRNGFSLIEVVVTMTIIAVLVSFATPSMSRAMEQSHADLVGAGLRSISVAQRFYWLDNRTYAPNLQTLIDADLLDGNITVTAARYEFSIAAADDTTFQAQARRRSFDDEGNSVYTGAWQGTFTVDQTGVIGGVVQGPESPISNATPQISPSF